MIAYLVFCSLLIPANLWAAITPHLHSDLSMRVLHGIATVALMPLLLALWQQRRHLQPVAALVLGVFAVVLVIVNSWITAMGMGVEFGWLDHVLLALSTSARLYFSCCNPNPRLTNRMRRCAPLAHRRGDVVPARVSAPADHPAG